MFILRNFMMTINPITGCHIRIAAQPDQFRPHVRVESRRGIHCFFGVSYANRLVRIVILQLKPESMCPTLKTRFWYPDTWLLIPSWEPVSLGVNFNLGSDSVLSLNRLHAELWSPVYTIVLNGCGPYKNLHAPFDIFCLFFNPAARLSTPVFVGEPL